MFFIFTPKKQKSAGGSGGGGGGSAKPAATALPIATETKTHDGDAPTQ
jgi:hypothetical protein